MASPIIGAGTDGISSGHVGEAQLNTIIDRLNQHVHHGHHHHHSPEGKTKANELA